MSYQLLIKLIIRLEKLGYILIFRNFDRATLMRFDKSVHIEIAYKNKSEYVKNIEIIRNYRRI